MLPDPVALGGCHMWVGDITSNTSAITRTDVCDGEGMLGNMAVVNGRYVAVRELSEAKEGIHKELVIQALEAEVWRGPLHGGISLHK